MTSGAPWSVKGIDPKAREIAKDLARRSGMTLGEWLNQVIYDDNAQTAPGAPSLRTGPAVERPASENRAPRRSGEDLERVLSALHDLSERFDSSVHDQAEATARFERAIAELKTDQSKVAERLNVVEQGGGAAADGKVETLRALEGALNKVAGHLAAGESRHREAMSVMRRELGEEMARVGDHMNRKVLEVENRGADAIAQVGAEVSRVATAVEQRLRRADDSQAEALEKLGGEIARITERLSERIAAAERRAAQAVEDVGEQVARVTDRIHARQERNESELVDRMRQSEERTAKLLEEARQSIDRRLLRVGMTPAEEPPPASAFADRWTPVDGAAPAAGRETAVHDLHEAELVEAIEDVGADAESILEAPAYHGLTGGPQGEADYVDIDDDDHRAPVQPDAVGLESRARTLADDPEFLAPHDRDAMDAVARAIGEDPPPAEDEPWREAPVFDRVRASQPASEQEALRPSARDLIVEARAAAFAEQSSSKAPADVDALELDAEPEDRAVPFSSLGQRKAKTSTSMRGVLLAGGAAASIGLAAAGGYIALHPETSAPPNPVVAKQIPVGPPSTPAAAPAPQAAVALATAPAPAAGGAAKSDMVDLDSLFRDASAKVDAGDPSGVAPLRTAANLGYAPAQRRLGKLFEDGGAGVEKDPVEGRRWTVRAAANGDPRAMHNLGLDYYEGAGGPKSLSVAAEWFSRAAQLGLRDSQYNLARFYEAGIGVQRDLSAAYRWYLIAGRAGDTEAAARGAALKAQLTPADSMRAEAQASAFRPDLPAPPVSLVAGLQSANAKQLALAARALTKLGYYKGTDDGAPSEALGEAIQAYQRDRGLAENGQLSPELVQTFAHISQ